MKSWDELRKVFMITAAAQTPQNPNPLRVKVGDKLLVKCVVCPCETIHIGRSK